MRKMMRSAGGLLLSAGILAALLPADVYASGSKEQTEKVTLRVCNWEEYIDLGDWDEEDAIELEDGTILGVNSMVEDFEEWYYDTYGMEVEVEYSTFGTNEDLYNRLTLGDVYDLVCPSEYMIMKLIAEDMAVPLSDSFFDSSDPNNYYTNGVSPYIETVFETSEVGGEPWAKYAAGYMWGITGIVYNPEVVTAGEASTWTILDNKKFNRQVTLKDNVRDAYFAAVGAIKSDLLTSEEFLSGPEYKERLEEEMNDVTPETMAAAQRYLQAVKNNAYSFETDSGKADMITGKVVANYQWSGDAVYSLDQAEEDGYILNFAVPEESTNIYFDGWIMLKNGIGEDARKQQAAEAFINFLSRPDNAIRNMYYIGYTSVISGGEDNRIFDYVKWNYEAEEDSEDTVEYPLGYFFDENGEDADYTLTVDSEQLQRQLYAQYPDAASIERSSIMTYMDQEQNEQLNQMWIGVRCFNIYDIPVFAWVLAGMTVVAIVILFVRYKRKA